MTDTAVIGIALQAMIVCAKVAGPFLGVTLGVGFVISVFQSATQIQEQTLTFVPKVIAVALVILFFGNWMLHTVTGFTEELFEQIPSLLGRA